LASVDDATSHPPLHRRQLQQNHLSSHRRIATSKTPHTPSYCTNARRSHSDTLKVKHNLWRPLPPRQRSNAHRPPGGSIEFKLDEQCLCGFRHGTTEWFCWRRRGWKCIGISKGFSRWGNTRIITWDTCDRVSGRSSDGFEGAAAAAAAEANHESIVPKVQLLAKLYPADESEEFDVEWTEESGCAADSCSSVRRESEYRSGARIGAADQWDFAGDGSEWTWDASVDSKYEYSCSASQL
jgi:hypothetical protein